MCSKRETRLKVGVKEREKTPHIAISTGEVRRNDEDVIVDLDIDGGHGRLYEVNMSNCPTVLADLNSKVCWRFQPMSNVIAFLS